MCNAYTQSVNRNMYRNTCTQDEKDTLVNYSACYAIDLRKKNSCKSAYFKAKIN